MCLFTGLLKIKYFFPIWWLNEYAANSLSGLMFHCWVVEAGIVTVLIFFYKSISVDLAHKGMIVAYLNNVQQQAYGIKTLNGKKKKKKSFCSGNIYLHLYSIFRFLSLKSHMWWMCRHSSNPSRCKHASVWNHLVKTQNCLGGQSQTFFKWCTMPKLTEKELLNWVQNSYI